MKLMGKFWFNLHCPSSLSLFRLPNQSFAVLVCPPNCSYLKEKFWEEKSSFTRDSFSGHLEREHPSRGVNWVQTPSSGAYMLDRWCTTFQHSDISETQTDIKKYLPLNGILGTPICSNMYSCLYMGHRGSQILARAAHRMTLTTMLWQQTASPTLALHRCH